jgi:uncharacterized protein YidB (DUF937 family)
MSIFDSLKAVFGQGDTAALPGLLSEGLANTNLGDLQGLVNKLQEGGLGPQVQSWLSDGQNLPVTPDLLKGALADEHVQQLAQHFGIDPDAVLNLLAEHLPTAVDQGRQQGSVST